MNKNEIQYFANIIFTAFANNTIKECEQQAFDQIVNELAPSHEVLIQANELASSPKFNIQLVGNFSSKVKNIEDMLYVAISDNDLDKNQSEILQSCINELGLTQCAADTLIAEAENRLLKSISKNETQKFDITSPIILSALSDLDNSSPENQSFEDNCTVNSENLQDKVNFELSELKKNATSCGLYEIEYALVELNDIFDNLSDENKQIILDALKTTKSPFHILFYLVIADNCEELLKTPKYYIYKNMLNITGEGLKKLYKLCLNELLKLDYITESLLQDRLQRVESIKK